ncbi:NADH-quinone oxidoreductase subunit C [Opitutales bacterium]|jgi:NADH-quinone oxidoreductase subunit C|nr:NADH-quinone oxidoreductase subunit C [Opitutales bacterium]
MSRQFATCRISPNPLGSLDSMIDDDFVKSLLNGRDYLSFKHHEDCLTINCLPESLVDFTKHLRDEETFDLLVDLTAVDHGDGAEKRFSVVLHFYSLVHKSYLRIHVLCPDNEAPCIPSVSSVFPAANWHERETFDMFGINFLDHPNLKRILMWDDYPYFPLRKEFPLAGIEVPLPAADVAEVTGADVDPAPMMGGPFVASGNSRMSEAEPRAKDESWTEKSEKPL